MSVLLFNLKTYLNAEDSLKSAAVLNALKTDNEVLIAPQALSLYPLSKKPRGKNVSLCAQNFDYAEGYGAHTGDVLIQDLKGIGCRYAMIGHSEVRHRKDPRTGESDALISKKVRLCLENGVTPVLCYGETREEKDGGKTESVIIEQLKSAFSEVNDFAGAEVVLAYEPVWAISSMKGAESCGVEYVAKVFELTKITLGDKIRYRFLYGGSVNGDNIRGYISSGFIDGVLIGKAGTEAESLQKIISAL
jgi:triosephosphate isomerase